MVRPKGGKRQPRYFQLKEAAEQRLCRLMEPEQLSPLEKLIRAFAETENAIQQTKERI